MLWLRQAAAGLRVLAALTVVLGLGYPLAVLGAGQLLMPGQANGSMVERDGEPVGSRLIGQPVEDPSYFHGRPSAAGEGYDPLSSGASNLAPTSPELLAAVEERRAAAAELNGVPPEAVPPDALTASGSGLDPHISPAYARLQADRVARERGMDPAAVAALVEEHVQGRGLGFLGEPAVNVLELNLALDEAAEAAGAGGAG
ncbi:K+-transporting ATPase ATPase C chain [Allonocardiopsis opalescens]|uniref:Potassium-transporting ATPase KdpC subunit n=2 Tax=Allonocardiopsis opalescens TaxID=1144618 RepID=A0A2T0PTD0_9ACTN|nr:K+-transporting ATPase ATPase C chain [Allonocardiopsis opalescens]